MVKVTIPDCMKPDFVCEINFVPYSYPAGTEQTVPEEVAAVIENHMQHQPKPANGDVDYVVPGVKFVVGTVMDSKLEDWNDYQKNRMSAVLTEGSAPFPTSFKVPYYLIPVPKTATRMAAVCPGLHSGPQFFTEKDGVFTLVNDVGWQTLNGFTYPIEAGKYDYVAINFKNEANGNFTDDYDTGKIAILFK